MKPFGKVLRSVMAACTARLAPRQALADPIAIRIAAEPRRTSRRAGEAGESAGLIMATKNLTQGAADRKPVSRIRGFRQAEWSQLPRAPAPESSRRRLGHHGGLLSFRAGNWLGGQARHS